MTLQSNQELDAEFLQQLRRYLQARLPGFMVPSLFFLLEDLPVTSSGKINYQALSAFNLDQQSLKPTFVAPRTPLESAIADIWVNILGLQQVGITDNFFQLGGHSLLVTQTLARINRTLHVELPLGLFFEKPTIAALAEYIEKQQAATSTEERQPSENTPEIHT